MVELVSNLSDVSKAQAELKKGMAQQRKTDMAALAAATSATAASSSIAAAVCMFGCYILVMSSSSVQGVMCILVCMQFLTSSLEQGQVLDVYGCFLKRGLHVGMGRWEYWPMIDLCLC